MALSPFRFTAGQRVVCVDSSRTSLVKGETYTVEEQRTDTGASFGGFVVLVEDPETSFMADRFKSA